MELIATGSGQAAGGRFAAAGLDLAHAAQAPAPASRSSGLAHRILGVLRRLRQNARDHLVDAACQRRPDQADATQRDMLRIVARRHY